ncbi:Proline-rich protein 23A3 [Lemmus lemmus]
MLKMPPQSPKAYPMPCWGPQPEEPNPANHRRLQEPACLGSLAQLDLEASARPARKELTSTVVIPTGCAMKLNLEGIDLLLEPEPNSVRRVSLPGHTIILVPEGLQASSQPGQPVNWPAGMQEAAVPDMLQDHHVFALHQGFNSAERYAPCSIWSLKSSTRWPLPSSQLQPLPPSPPPSHQEQTSESRQKPPRPLCRAKRRLF